MKTELEELNNYTGPSMNPTFKAGDGLIVAPYKDEEIRPGDVITFKPKDRSRNVVHRVIRVDRHGVYTRGDNNNMDYIKKFVDELVEKGYAGYEATTS